MRQIKYATTPTAVGDLKKGVRYQLVIPVTWDQGITKLSVVGSYFETHEQNALQEYNRLRAHDGQAPLSELPDGCLWFECLQDES